MINTSAAYKEAIKKNRILHHEAKIEFADGAVLTPQDQELYTFKISENSSNQESFDIGSAIAKQLEVKIDNINETYSEQSFSGAKITARVGLEVSGKTEWLKKGVFYAEPGEFSGDTVSVTALDSMTKFDNPYTKSKLAYPATLGEIVRDACSVCGVSMSADIAAFPQDGFTVKKRPSDTSLTFRQILQYVGQIACVNFRINADDRLTASWYDTDLLESEEIEENAETVKVENYTGTIGTDDVVVTGVKVIEETASDSDTNVEYTYGTDGYVLKIEENKLIQDGKGSTVAEFVGKKVNGLTFRPMTVKVQGDPSVEPGDIAVVTDRKGRTYKTILTGVMYTAKASQELLCGATTPERLSATRYSKATQVYRELRKSLIEQKSETEKAFESLKESMDEKQGLFPVSEKQEDGSCILYFCDKPTKEESKILIKLNAQGWGMSTDGGETWNVGALVDGTTITKVLSAIGINAEWINAGMVDGKRINAKGLTVSQKDGTNTLIIDDEGNIDASFRTLSIAGTAAASENYAEEKSAAALEAAKIYADSKSSNLLQGTDFSAESTKTYWNLSGTVEQSQTDPKGGKNAVRLRGTANDNFLGAKYAVNNPVVTAGQYEIRIWLKSNAARTVTVSLNREKYQCNVTTAWKQFKFAVKVTEPNTEGRNNFVIGGWSSVPSGAILYIYNPQVLYSYTAADVLNMLTDNGAMDGIYMYNNQLYVKGKYIDVDDLKAIGAKIGGFTIGNTSIYNGCTSLTSAAAGVYLGTKGIMIRKDADNYMRYSVSSGLTLAGGTINAAKINSPTIKIGRATLSAQDTDSAMVVRNGMHVYNATSGELFTDGSGLFKIFNVTHVSSGGHLVFGPDGAEVCYLSSSSKRYKDHVSGMTIEEAEKVLDIPVVWFKYKEGYLRDGDPMTGKPIPGFYAEDVLEKFPAGAQLKDGLAEDWNYRTLIPPMLMLIQKLYREVEKNG